MGKLHTLKRAIERNPEIWTDGFGRVFSAQRRKGQWEPLRFWYFGKAYKAFVAHTLKELTTCRGE